MTQQNLDLWVSKMIGSNGIYSFKKQPSCRLQVDFVVTGAEQMGDVSAAVAVQESPNSPVLVTVDDLWILYRS